MRTLWLLLLCLPLGCATPDGPNSAHKDISDPPLAEDATKTHEALEMLKASIERYRREVKGYRANLIKQERIDGKLYPVERIVASFRQEPFSVRMEWTEGARLATKTLYVKGENDNQVVVMPAGWLSLAGQVLRSPEGADAKNSSRMPITEFGILAGCKRTLAAWKRGFASGDFDVQMNGIKKVAELGDRECHEVVRTVQGEPNDGVRKGTFYFDVQTGLQTGTILQGDEGELLGAYWFRDVQINPEFPQETFTRQGLRK
jgi:hypothetical protein